MQAKVSIILRPSQSFPLFMRIINIRTKSFCIASLLQIFSNQRESSYSFKSGTIYFTIYVVVVDALDTNDFCWRFGQNTTRIRG